MTINAFNGILFLELIREMYMSQKIRAVSRSKEEEEPQFLDELLKYLGNTALVLIATLPVFGILLMLYRMGSVVFNHYFGYHP
jgi:hypothetical protein